MSKALEDINSKLKWQLAAQAGTLLAVTGVSRSVDHLSAAMGQELNRLSESNAAGFNQVEHAIRSLEFKLLAGLGDLEWRLASIDSSLLKLVGLVEYPSATASAEKYIQATELYSIGKTEKALDILGKSLDENPLNVNAIIGQVLCHKTLGNSEDSLKALRELMDISKTDYTYQVEESEQQKKASDLFITRFILGSCLDGKQHQLGLDFLSGLDPGIADDAAIFLQHQALRVLSGQHDDVAELLVKQGALGRFMKSNLITDTEVMKSFVTSVEKAFLNLVDHLESVDLLGESELELNLKAALRGLRELRFQTLFLLGDAGGEQLLSLKELLIMEAKAVQTGHSEMTSEHRDLLTNVETYRGLKVQAIKEKVQPFLQEDFDDFVTSFTDVLEADLRKKEVKANTELKAYESKHGKAMQAALPQVEWKSVPFSNTPTEGLKALKKVDKATKSELYDNLEQCILRGCLSNLGEADNPDARSEAMTTGLFHLSQLERAHDLRVKWQEAIKSATQEKPNWEPLAQLHLEERGSLHHFIEVR